MTAYFLMLDCLKATGARMYDEAVPELMRAFELPKREAERVACEWAMRENGRFFEKLRCWVGRD